MRPGQREVRGAVIESRRRPSGGRVAIITQMGEGICDVIRVSYAGEVALMATVASRRRVGVAGGMAGKALETGMGAGKRETCRGVIKCCRRPGRSRVARHAVMVEIIRRMVGVSR